MYRKNFPHRKEKRRKEAEERNAAYAKLTLTQKLDRLTAAGFTYGRQYNRLLIQIHNNK